MANMSFGVNILPKTNNTYTLGNSNYQWNIFVNQINGRDVIDLALPVVTSTNNGQILKVENGAWTVGTAPTSLPSVSSTDNGKVLQVSNGVWTVDTFTISSLATVATTGSYNDLSNKPLPVPTSEDEYKVLVVSDGAYILVNDWEPFHGLTETSHGTIGLVPRPYLGEEGRYLCSNGYWSTLPVMTGATYAANGKAGTVPAPTTTDINKFLCGNGTWATALTGVTLVSTSLTPSNGVVTIPAMTGATSSAAGTAGLVPAPASADREKFFRGDGTWQDGGRPMVILSYGSSTWADFEAAYNNNVIVYCRASSNSNPATGSQTRMAFMAYVNNATTPTNVEFQYYRSVNAHSATQMGDQVFIYKLDKTSGWSVTTREASIKEINVASGSKLGVSWSSNKVTLSNTMTANDMPMSSSDATTAKAAIDALDSNIENLVKTVQVTWDDASIASGEYKEFSKALTNIDPTGYTFVALTLRTTGSRHVFFVDYEIRNVSNVRTLFVHVKNTATSSVDGAPIVRLHYVKTGCATE